MNEENCPSSLLDPPGIVPLDVIDAVTLDSEYGSLLDLFSEWEGDCEIFWNKAEKLIFEKKALADNEDLWGFFNKQQMNYVLHLSQSCTIDTLFNQKFP